MLSAWITHGFIGLIGLALGLFLAWYVLRQHYSRNFKNAEVRWARRITDGQAEREENQARLDKTLRHAQEREQTLQQALSESEETVALLSDEKLPAYEQDLANRNSRITELEQTTAHQRAEIADAKDFTETLTDQLERFAVKLKDKDTRIEELSESQAQLAEFEALIEQQQQHQADLIKKLDRRNESLDGAQTKLADRDAQLVTRQSELTELTRVADQLRADNTARDTDIATLQDELENSERRSAVLEEELRHIQLQMQEQDEQLRQKIAKLEAEQLERENALKTVQSDLESAKRRIPELEMQVSDSVANVARIATLQQRIAEMESVATNSEARIGELTSELADIQNRVPELEHDVQARDQRLAELVENLETQRQQKSQLEQETIMSQSKINQLESDKEQSLRLVTELQTSDQQQKMHNQQLQTERDQLESQLPDLKESSRVNAATIEDLRSRVSGYERRLPDYEAQIHSRDAQIARLDKDFSSLRDKLPALNDALRERDASIEDLIAELAKERKRIRKLKQQNQIDIEVDRSNTNVIHLRRHFAKSELPAPQSSPVMPSDSGRRLRSAEAEAQRWKRQYEARVNAGVETTGSDSGYRPVWCLSKPHGQKDDLRKIRGIGPMMERMLNELGVFHFDQLAGLHKPDIQWVAKHINSFPGRIERDRWIEQARELAGQPMPDSKVTNGQSTPATP